VLMNCLLDWSLPETVWDPSALIAAVVQFIRGRGLLTLNSRAASTKGGLLRGNEWHRMLRDCATKTAASISDFA
jgi:hypothetical protein